MRELIDIAKKALFELQAQGADKAQCVAARAEKLEFNALGGEFTLLRTLFDDQLSLVAIKGGKRGTIAVNRMDDEAISAAAKDCVSVAEGGVADEAFDIAPNDGGQELSRGQWQPDRDKLFARCKEFLQDISREFPNIVVEEFVAEHKRVDTVYLNSNGQTHHVKTARYGVDVMYSAHEGEKGSSFFGTGVAIASLDKPFMQCGSMREDIRHISMQIDAEPFKGKFEGVAVLPPAMFGELMAIALDNFISDSVLIDKTSIWRDKLGEAVADKRLTIASMANDERIVTGLGFTGEGFKSEDEEYIKNGELKSFMLSLYGANKTGNKRAGNTAMQLVIKPGDKPLEDIIKNVKRGIYVKRFSGGQPSSNGDFSGVAKNSFLIEDGKLTKPLSEVMINGNLADMMKNLIDISKETVSDGMSVLPYAAFGGVTVSGK